MRNYRSYFFLKFRVKTNSCYKKSTCLSYEDKTGEKHNYLVIFMGSRIINHVNH